MKKRIRKVLSIVLAAVCLWSIGQVVFLAIENYKAEQKHNLALSIVGATPIVTEPASNEPAPEATGATSTQPTSSTADSTPTEPNPAATEAPQTETTPPVPTGDPLPPDINVRYMQQLNIGALQAINPDIIGWIYIPATQVNYPLLHADDNSTYLYSTWDGDSNSAGSIFMEAECSADLTDFNTIIYGHNMLNGSMFATLHRYSDYSFYQAHPYVYIATNDGVYRYEVFGTYSAGIRTDTYGLLTTEEEKTQAVAHYISRSIWTGERTPTTEDSVLTLSTCIGSGTYATRWVVQAVLDDQWSK